MDNSFQPFEDSSALLDRSGELRRRMRQDGYLFLPGLLSAEPVERVRLDVLEILSRSGLLDPNEPPEKGIYRGGPPPGRDALLQFHLEINRLESFEALPHEAPLLAAAGALIDGPPHVHTRKICRVKYPADPYDIVLPHQDFWYIKGSRETYSAWIPLMEIGPAEGGLAVARGSHMQGPLPHQTTERSRFAGVSETLSDALDWRGSPFQQGDALLFHSCAVHQGLLNSSRRIRLSMDCRYQREGSKMDPSHSRPHFEPRASDR